LETLRQAKREQEQFLSTKAWKDYESLVKSQIRSLRQEDFVNPISSMDDAFVSCERKAKIAGMMLALALPQAVIDDLAADIEVKAAELEGEKSWLARMKDRLSNPAQTAP
jgi:hypothetical protein